MWQALANPYSIKKEPRWRALLKRHSRVFLENLDLLDGVLLDLAKADGQDAVF